MEKYKNVSPDMVQAILNIAQKEQEHRHQIDFKKLEIIRNSDEHVYKMNVFGMCFSFFIIIGMLVVMVLAMVYNSTWLTAVSVVALFLLLLDLSEIKEKQTRILQQISKSTRRCGGVIEQMDK